MKLSYLPLGLFGLVDLVLFGLVASGEQQHGHALRHSPIRRLSTGTCGAGYIAPQQGSGSITVDGDVSDWEAASGTTPPLSLLDSSHPLFIQDLIDATSYVRGTVSAFLDCTDDLLYMLVSSWPLIQDETQHYVNLSPPNTLKLSEINNKQWIFHYVSPNALGWEAAIPLSNFVDCQPLQMVLSSITLGALTATFSLDLTCPTTNNNNGAAFGDPHLKTWKGDVYDFHGGCDLVLLKHLAYASMLGLEIHIRTTIRRDWSYISAAALKIGNDILEVHSGATHYLNGVEGAVLPASLAGFLVTVKAHGQKRHKFTVTLENGCVVVFKVYGDFLAVSVNNAGIDFADSSGMMGSFPNGEFRARDGETVIGDTKEFGLEWQVQQGDPVLFLKPEGPQYPQTCDMPELVDTATGRRHRRLSEESMVSLEEAEEACQFWPEDGRDACVYDVLSTGDLNMAEAGAF